jgi:EAL domain-containing protein (putative c-di-GMP-specific phosphodiesterase class I)
MAPPQRRTKINDRRKSGRRFDDDSGLLERLSGAPGRGEFSLVYQRQVAPDGVGLVGVETLLRWDCPTFGAMAPERFIPLAERARAIAPVTRWVLDRAMAETGDLANLSVGFNASATEFTDPAFVGEIAALVRARGFDPARLEIEVTETAILADAEVVHRNMDALHDIGVRIVLDDFGAGYSSLNHLRLFPFDKLKIDKAFVGECSHSPRSAALINAVAGLGKALGMQVVAEGVETESQRAFLAIAGVDAMQGYLFGKAVGADELRQALEPAAQVVRAAP